MCCGVTDMDHGPRSALALTAARWFTTTRTLGIAVLLAVVGTSCNPRPPPFKPPLVRGLPKPTIKVPRPPPTADETVVDASSTIGQLDQETDGIASEVTCEGLEFLIAWEEAPTEEELTAWLSEWARYYPQRLAQSQAYPVASSIRDVLESVDDGQPAQLARALACAFI